MKLRHLNEADQDLHQLGYKIAKSTDEELMASLADDYPEVSVFFQWVRDPKPREWLGVSETLKRMAKQLFQYGKTEGDDNAIRAGRRWAEIANLDAATLLGATAAAPDGAARGSEVEELNFPDGITRPIIDTIGEQAFQTLVTTLSSDRDLLTRVLKAIHGSLSTLE